LTEGARPETDLAPSGWGRADLARVAVGMALVAAISFPYLGALSAWYDEAFSMETAYDWALMLNDSNMWLHSTLLRGIRLVDESLEAARALSTVAAILAIPVAASIAKRLFDARVAGHTAILLSLNLYLLFWAIEARSYSLLVLLSLVATRLFLKALDDGRDRWWIAHGVAGALGFYTHFFGLLVVVAQALSTRCRPLRGLAVSAATQLVLAIPFFMLAGFNRGQISWIPQVDLEALLLLFKRHAGGGRMLAFDGLLVAWALWGSWRASRASPVRSTPRPIVFLLVWWLAPIGLAILLSFSVQPVFQNRYLICCVPPLVMLASVCLARLPAGWMRAAAVILLVVITIRALPRIHYEIEDWNGLTERLVAEYEPGDRIVYQPWGLRRPYLFAMERRKGFERAPSLTPLAPNLETLELLHGTTGRIWLLTNYNTNWDRADEEAWQVKRAIDAGWQRVEVKLFQGASLELYEPRLPAPRQ